MAEIVGIVAGVVAPALELGKCFKKQFNYLCCLKTNIKDLQVAAAKMEDKRVDLQDKVEAAKRNGELILREVETWLADAEETQRTAQEIMEAQIPARIFSLKPRYSLSRKAMKKTESMNKLRANCTFDHVSNPAPPASMGQTPPLRPGIGSRMKTEEDIILAMRDQDVYVIGVGGMGGVGKTTMAKQIMNRVREEDGLFDEVVLVAVGQQADMLKIQRGIADWLGIKFEEETLAPRAHRLRARLEGGKRKLIVIDDVWERINLEDLGIPCESGSCTILLTSRNMKVFDVTDNKKVFTIETLSDEEAWLMFKENVGACMDDLNLLPIAKEVAKECKGLPLALVAVSRALKGKVSKPIWLDALKQLRRSNPVDIEDVISEVYNPIKLSYDFLGSPHAKSLLFLCSSFPEDHDINLEYLMFYSFGLCMFDEISNLEEARNRIATLISTLKSRSLILDGNNEDYVKMHDVVRDVAIFIAAEEKHAIVEISSSNEWSREIPYTDCTMLSVVVGKEQKVELHMELAATFRNLRFLWMHNHDNYEDHQSMSDHFLKGMQQLKVLHIKRLSFGSTPQSMEQLKNLHTLHLYECDLKTLSPVGELSSLEILICRSCRLITELPVEIGRLSRLRLLDVSGCERLKTIKSGVISRLGRLEELKMLYSFKGWESVEEGSNVSLVELESLSKLRCLEIEIEDWSLAAQELQLLSSSNIVKYDITVGKRSHLEWIDFITNYEKKLSLKFPKGETLLLSIGKWIDAFAKSADFLDLKGDASNTFDFALGCQNKKRLELVDCPTVEKLGVFPVLEWLRLRGLLNLVEICDGSNNSFAKLKNIEISGCGKLRSPFRSSLEVIRSLSQQLERLVISECGSMEEVFSIELLQEDIVSPITFPKLKILVLSNLESLTTLCKGIIHDDIINMNIEFPRLLRLDIQNCPKLMKINNIQFPLLGDLIIVDCPKLVTRFINIDSDLNCASSSSSAHIQDSIPRHALFCNEKVQFGNLKTLGIGGYENITCLWCHHIPQPFFRGLEDLEISKCANINNLFSYSIAENLGNLKKLTIKECKEMVYVIADDKAETKKRLNLIDCPTVEKLGVFPVLENLCLERLPNLVEIWWDGSNNNSFAKLNEIWISGCSKLRSVFTSSLEVITSLSQQLELLHIEDCESMEEVFSIELLQENIVSPITFPKLRYLRLTNLPSLTTLCKGNIIHADMINNIQFPLLWDLVILDCPKLVTSLININSDLNCSSSSSSSAHIQDSIPRHALFCNEKVKFGSLKTLGIGGYENMSYVWCHHIPHPFFRGLEQLGIYKCANIKNLFSYSIAANLGNLETLIIYRCNEMVHVIADDKAETTVPLTIIFHKLEKVILSSLPKLASFCEGRWSDLQFPSLKEVEIIRCPDMKGFSLGSISTPNLKEFTVDEHKKSVEDFIKHPWQQEEQN